MLNLCVFLDMIFINIDVLFSALFQDITMFAGLILVGWGVLKQSFSTPVLMYSQQAMFSVFALRKIAVIKTKPLTLDLMKENSEKITYWGYLRTEVEKYH